MASWRAPDSIFEAPGSIFEAPRLDFGGSWDDFFEIWGLLAEKMQELVSNFKLKLRSSSLKLEWPFLSLLHRRSATISQREGGRR